MPNDAANDPAAGEDAPKFLHDNFLEWCHDQPVPVIEDFGIDMMTIQMDPFANRLYQQSEKWYPFDQ